MSEHPVAPTDKTNHKKPLKYDAESEVVRQQVAPKVIGLSVATICRRVRDDPTFPRRIKLGKNSSGFIRSELLEWLAKQAGAR